MHCTVWYYVLLSSKKKTKVLISTKLSYNIQVKLQHESDFFEQIFLGLHERFPNVFKRPLSKVFSRNSVFELFTCGQCLATELVVRRGILSVIVQVQG